MIATQVSAQNVFQHHVEALGRNDLKDLMSDYTEQSDLWTPDGTIIGLHAISSFYSNIFPLFPKDKTQLEIKKMISNDDKVYIVWTADSPMVNVSFATDCFEIKEGKISWQTTAFQMAAK